MSKSELLKRYAVFTLSLFVISLGISIVTRANLGTSPISSTPYVFSLNTPISMGSGLFLLGILFIIVQVLMLGVKEAMNKKGEILAQIPITFIFGVCTDLSMWALEAFMPTLYAVKVTALVVGSFVLALGISLEVVAGVAMMGGEYTIQVATKRYKKEFGTIKIIFDITMVVMAIISSLLFSQTIEGVREGTVIAALLTGPFVRIIMPRLGCVRQWQSESKVETRVDEVGEIEEQPILITISREYGSGGHYIGETLAKRLGIPFYDYNLVEMVAREGDFSEQYVSQKEQSIERSLLSQMIMDYEAPLEKSLSNDDMLFVAQSKVLNRIAQQGSCVIVGRCANFILDKYQKKIDIFLHASMEYKKRRAVEQYDIEPEKAEAEITRKDKARANHYFHYTGKTWGDAKNYHLSFDSSVMEADLICQTVESLYSKFKK